MHQAETITQSTIPPEMIAGPENAAEITAASTEALGHVALAGQPLDETYASEGVSQLEAIANGEPVEADNRIHDVDAAHEAAILENEIFDAHSAAIKENEIFDAHEAALKENEERDRANTPEAKEPTKAPERVLRQDGDAKKVSEARHDQVTTALNPRSAEELRREVVEVLKQTDVRMQIPPESEISEDVAGNLLIANSRDAMVITRMPDGAPKLTEYHYDKDSGTLTVDTKLVVSVLPDHSPQYQSTEMGDWQTHGEVITLPPTIAKRFGIDRAVASNQENSSFAGEASIK